MNINRTLQTLLFGILLCFAQLNLFAQDCNYESSTLLFDLNECKSFSGLNSPMDYSEFTAEIINSSNSSSLSVVGDHLYRLNPQDNKHSCSMGLDGTITMCVSSQDTCDYVADSDMAIRFDIQVVPGPDGFGRLSLLEFYEAAKDSFGFIHGASGPNNYPTLFGLRVSKNGNEIYRDIDIPTNRDFTYFKYDFSDNPEFKVSNTTVFNFELLPYCLINNGATVTAWDVENIKLYAHDKDNVNGGNLTFLDGTAENNICKDDLNISSPLLTNSIGNHQKFILTNLDSVILDTTLLFPYSYPSNFPNSALIWSISSDSLLSNHIPGFHIDSIVGCLDFSNPIKININDLPIVEISGELNICTDETTTLTANPVLASNPYSFNWSTGATSQTISNVGPGLYSVTLTDRNGCTDVSTALVNLLSNPNIVITGDDEICLNDSTTLQATGGTTYLWSNGATSSSIKVSPPSTTSYGVTVTNSNGCIDSSSIDINVNPLPTITISGDSSICKSECTELIASGGISYSWLNANNSCNGSFFVGSEQGMDLQNIYTFSSNGLDLVTNIQSPNINGIGSYCLESMNTEIFGMQRLGDSQSDALRANFMVIDPNSGVTSNYGEIPMPQNPYGVNGTTGIISYVGDISHDGIFYFPAIAAEIDPSDLNITNYTIYLGKINLHELVNGLQVDYDVLNTDISCQSYMDNFISSFIAYVLDPTMEEPSGGIHDWALNPDNTQLISFLGIENVLFTIELETLSSNCIFGPNSNFAYVGTTGTNTDEFGGIYFEDDTLYGWQVDRGRLFQINQTNGELSLIADNLPNDFRGDNAICQPCNSSNNSNSIIVCPESDTKYVVEVQDQNGCVNIKEVTVKVFDLPDTEITGESSICVGESTTLTAEGGDSYSWSNGETSSSITVSPATNTKYFVTVTNSNDCRSIDSLTVNVNPNPTPSISGDDQICSGEATTLTASDADAYNWSNGETTKQITVSPNSTESYALTVTNEHGCQGSTSFTVNVNPNPTPSISGDDQICSGDATTLTASDADAYNWSNGETTKQITVSPNSTESYTLTVTNEHGCQGSTSFTVNVNPNPTPSISGDDQICNGEATTLTASDADAYNWSNGETTKQITVSPNSTESYTLTVTNEHGCQGSTSFTVNVNPNPTPSISGDDQICSGEATTLTASDANAYNWSNGETTKQITVSPNSTESYTLTVTNEHGCQGSTSFTVNVNPNPTPSISGDDQICNGEATTLTASDADAYNWSNGETTKQIIVSPNSTESYTLTVTNEHGCQGSTSFTVNVNPNPTPSISGDDQICNGEATTLTASDADAYNWSNGETTKQITVSPNSTESYALTVTNEHGCQGSTSFTVKVNPNPTPSISGDDQICSGDATTLTASDADAYNWSNGETTKQITVSPNSTESYALTVTNEHGCKGSTSFTVNVNPNPTPSISGDDHICSGDATTLTASDADAYNWSNGETTKQITVSPNSTESYALTVTNEHGCQGSTSFTVNVNPNPTPSISGDDQICSGDATTLTASDADAYNWSNGETTKQITVSPNSTESYVLTVTNEHGCQGSTSFTVNVNPNPTPSISGDDQICSGDATTLTASDADAYNWSNGETTKQITVSPNSTESYALTVTNEHGCQGSTSFTVNVNPNPTPSISGDDQICSGEATTLTASDADAYNWNNGETTKQITVSPNSTESYALTVTNEHGCQGSTSFTVNVNPNPTPSISGDDQICSGDATTLTASDADAYNWSNGETTKQITVGPNSTESYALTVTNEHGCQGSTSFTVNVNPNPTPSISGDDQICSGDVTTLTASDADAYNWSNGETTKQITVSPNSTESYALTVTNEHGCQGSTSFTVNVNPNPTPSISGVDSICIGASTTLTASDADAYNWSNGETTKQITVSPNSTESYTLTVTNEHGCQGSTSFTVNVNPNPTPSISGDDQICSGDATTLTASDADAYNWSNGETTKQITVSPTSTESYALTVTNEHGCQGSTSFTVNVNPNPTPSISGDDQICSGEATTLTASDADAYNWSNGETTKQITVSPNSTESYALTVTNEHGCQGSTSFTVNVNPNPTPSISGVDSICIGASTTLTASDADAYIWSNGETTKQITVSPNSTESYTLTVTNEHGCQGSTSFTVVVSPTLNINANVTHTQCGLNNGGIDLNIEGGIPPYSISWSNGSTGPILTDLTTGTYVVTVSDKLGCEKTDSITVNFSHDVKIQIIAANASCLNNDGEAVVNVTQGNHPFEFSWSNGSTSSKIEMLSAGKYYVTVTDSIGCTKSDSIIIDNSRVIDNIIAANNFDYCIEGNPDMLTGIDVSQVFGSVEQWLITDKDDNILEIFSSQMALESFDLENLGAGHYSIYLITSDIALSLVKGQNLSDIAECHILSNPLDLFLQIYMGDMSNSMAIFNMEECLSKASDMSNIVYDEFTAFTANDSSCAQINIIGNHFYRVDADTNGHSCTPGLNGGTAICISSDQSCTFNPNSTKSLVVDFQLTPSTDRISRLEEISFHEKAPEMFDWIDGASGVNNWPTKFAVRLYKEGTLVYESLNLSTQQNWNERIFSFNGPEFELSAVTNFKLELMPYCPIGNSGVVTAWDIDNLVIEQKCFTTLNGGVFDSTQVDVCLDGVSSFLQGVNHDGFSGQFTKFVIVDSNSVITHIVDNYSNLIAFDLDQLGVGKHNIYGLAHDGSLTGCEIGNQFVSDLWGCFDISDPLMIDAYYCGTRFKIYPNPSNGVVHVSMESSFDHVDLVIFNSLGERIFIKTKISPEDIHELDLSNYGKGLYYLCIMKENNRITQPLIIVE